MQTQTNASPTAPAAAVVTHTVADFDAWKEVFDGHAPARRRAGIRSHLNRSLENPNQVMVYLAAGSAAVLQGFLSDPDTKNAMQKAGVVGAPNIAHVTPVEDMTAKARALPGAIVCHRVANFDAWKAAFDAHAGARATAGIIGHAVNRAADDENQVVVYLQAESADTLRQFIASPQLKSTMEKAGVQGATADRCQVRVLLGAGRACRPRATPPERSGPARVAGARPYPPSGMTATRALVPRERHLKPLSPSGSTRCARTDCTSGPSSRTPSGR